MSRMTLGTFLGLRNEDSSTTYHLGLFLAESEVRNVKCGVQSLARLNTQQTGRYHWYHWESKSLRRCRCGGSGWNVLSGEYLAKEMPAVQIRTERPFLGQWVKLRYFVPFSDLKGVT